MVPREPIRACQSRRPVGWARRRRSGRRARGSTSRPSGSSARLPVRSATLMAIVPGGEVRGTLGCAEFDTAAASAAAEVQAAGVPEMRTFHHPQGDVEVYLEPHRAPHRLVVVSATDVARSLRLEMERQGRRVIVLEPRAERIAPDDGPYVRSLDELTLGDDDEVVFTDHDAPGIADMLTALLRSPVRFIGVMGSRRHVAHYVEELRSRGFGDDDLRRIRSRSGSTSGDAGPRRSPSRSPRGSSPPITTARGGGWTGDADERTRAQEPRAGSARRTSTRTGIARS